MDREYILLAEREARKMVIHSVYCQAVSLSGETRDDESTTEGMMRRVRSEFLFEEAARLEVEFL